jgi:hypothetical protein
MLSRRRLVFLLAIPLILVLLWIASKQSVPEINQAAEPIHLSEQLLFLSPLNSPANLHAYDPLSGQTKTLTTERAIESFSPATDGLSVYFSEANNQFGKDIWQLIIGDLSTNLLIDCGPESCGNPQASPDGLYLAYTRINDATGLQQVHLLEFSSDADIALSPADQIAIGPQWSLDGQLSFYNQSLAAYQFQYPGENAQSLAPNALGELLAWLPESNAFIAAEAFAADSDILRGTTGEASLQTPEPGSQSTLELTVTGLLHFQNGQYSNLFDYGLDLVEDAAPVASPNGRWIAFTRKYLDEERWTPGRQLWIHEFESVETLPLTASANYQMSAISWSADSSTLAFVRSNRTDFNAPTEIWIIQPDGSDAHFIAVDAFAPQWLP